MATRLSRVQHKGHVHGGWAVVAWPTAALEHCRGVQGGVTPIPSTVVAALCWDGTRHPKAPVAFVLCTPSY